MWGSQIPYTLHKKFKKKMDKKFYEMPEIEVVDLELEGALLSDSTGEGPAPTDPTPGGEDDF